MRVGELDLAGDVVSLTQTLCDIPSVSGQEAALAEAIDVSLRAHPHLRVHRDGHAVLARTELGRSRRVVIAGHIDTVPVADNLPTRLLTQADGDQVLWGRGSVDMKSGLAVMLQLAAALTEPDWDVTWAYYDNEEVGQEANGLGRLARHVPEWLEADLAILAEPTGCGIEAGCNGTLQAQLRVPGHAAHSARPWQGSNAVHGTAEVLATLADYDGAEVEVDGLRYAESLQAVGICGGVAGNVVPDSCQVRLNYRFAPHTSPAAAEAHVRDVFAGYDIEILDAAAGARPQLGDEAVASAARMLGAVTDQQPRAKYGWTDVARFAALGVPAFNFGPGDPALAHADDEQCPTADIRSCRDALETWLTQGGC